MRRGIWEKNIPVREMSRLRSREKAGRKREREVWSKVDRK